MLILAILSLLAVAAMLDHRSARWPVGYRPSPWQRRQWRRERIARHAANRRRAS